MDDTTGSASIRNLLEHSALATGLELNARQMQQLETHFALLLKWNQKINLTAIRNPEEIAARHFEESLFLSKLLPPPKGLMIDVGSGAGFPGLPLKIAWPGTPAVLLEPNHKKATFLKEAIRSCDLKGIEVRAERLEAAAFGELASRASLVTMRAVKPSRHQDLVKLLQPGGTAALFLGAKDAVSITAPPASISKFNWEAPVPVPRSEQRVLLLGHLVGSSEEPIRLRSA